MLAGDHLLTEDGFLFVLQDGVLERRQDLLGYRVQALGDEHTQLLAPGHVTFQAGERLKAEDCSGGGKMPLTGQQVNNESTSGILLLLLIFLLREISFVSFLPPCGLTSELQ